MNDAPTASAAVPTDGDARTLTPTPTPPDTQQQHVQVTINSHDTSLTNGVNQEQLSRSMSPAPHVDNTDTATVSHPQISINVDTQQTDIDTHVIAVSTSTSAMKRNDESEIHTDNNEKGDEDGDDDDDDEEPKLKYQRLIGTLSETLAKDAVNCMDVSDRFLAIGTHWGVVHITDLIGTQVKQFKCHTASVNQVTIDTEGEYVASASDDGTVMINSLYTTDVQSFNFRRPVKVVCLEPGYGRKPTRQFVSGGMAEMLILTGKGWFGSTNITVHSGEGAILAASWRGSMIVWANEQSVCVYDTVTSQRFGRVERPVDAPRADLFRCCITWVTDSMILVGWADHVKVLEISDRSKQDIASGLSPKMVTVTHQFRTEYVVSGIAPLGDSLLILAYIIDVSPLRNIDVLEAPPPVDPSSTSALSLPSASAVVAVSATPAVSPKQRRQAQPPEVHIVNMDGEESANDVLSLLGFEHFQATDYRLVYLASPSDAVTEASYYIVSPKDIVVARLRGLDDHIEWLVERQRYGDALRAAESTGTELAGQSKINMILDIGQKYMMSLMASGRYYDAAASCPKLLRTNTDLWEQWIATFSDRGQLHVLTPFLPTQDPQLSHASYERVLIHYLDTDVESLLHILRVWPPTLYRLSTIIEMAHAVYVKDPDNTILLEIMLELYERNKQWDMVLQYGLKVNRPGVLDLVATYNLFQVMESHVLLVMKYDQVMVERAIGVLSRKHGGDGVVVVPPPPEAMHVPEMMTSQPPLLSSTSSSTSSSSTSMAGLDTPAVPNEPRPLQTVSIAIQRTRAAVGAQGVQLLATNADRILPFHVTRQLQGHSRYLHIYLDALFIIESPESVPLHPLQIELYAEYDYPRLLPFLRQSTHYDVTRAFEICEGRDLVPEMVYLLGKIGNSRKALMLIIERLGDVERAIQFAKDQNDQELWDEFLKYAMDKPLFIVGLLENLSAHIDPLRVIERIPVGLEIPGLKRALVKIMTDCSVQKSLREGCEKILMSDTWESFVHLHRSQRRGMCVKEEVECAMCGHAAVTPVDATDVVVFFCGHVMHEPCVSQGAVEDGTANAMVRPSGSEMGASSSSSTSAAVASVERAIDGVYASGRVQMVAGGGARGGGGGSGYAWRAGLVCPLCRRGGSGSSSKR